MYYSEQKKQSSVHNRRTFFLFLGKLSFFSIIGWRLFKIQILDSAKYKTLSKNNQINIEIIYPIRGKIKDRNEARKKGDYKLADIIRKELEDSGVIIEDKQDKTTWKYK